jgi:hypothetical protein
MMTGAEAAFGLNVADGRIKGYPTAGTGDDSMMDYRFVRGNDEYGENQFLDNGDGTISDSATGLMWTQGDSGDEAFAEYQADFSGDAGAMTWEEALAFGEGAAHHS